MNTNTWTKIKLILISFLGFLKLVAGVVDCGQRYHIAHGSVAFTGRDTSFNQKVPVTCDKGYRVQGDSHITCLKTGNWSQNTKCVPKDCGKNHTVENGDVSFDGRDTTFNHTVPVYCNKGFRTFGRPFITCLDDGSWSSDTICHPIDCGKTASIPNGQAEFDERDTYVDHKVPVSCDTGYRLQGDPDITCLQDGSWSTGTYCVIVDCGDTYSPDHIHIDYSGQDTTYGSSIPVSCDEGYELHGDPHFKCLSDGTWSTDTSCSIKDCGTDYSLPHGHVDFKGRTTTYNSIVPVTCDKGYQLHGERHITCLQDGTWSRTTQCLPTIDCGTRYTIENGFVNFTGRDTTFNHRVEVTCNPGYKIVGDHYIACLANGSWSKHTSCQLVDCGTKYSIAHGYPNFYGRDTTYKEIVAITCNRGYELKGDKHIICLENAQWSRKTSCKITNCSSTYTLENGHVDLTGRSLTYGQVAAVNCDEGYEIHGNPFITCLADGTWSKDTSCRKKDCGLNYDLENGYVKYTGSSTVGEKANLFCNAGYILEGDQDTTCLPDGTWSRFTKCQLKDCGTEYSIEHGYADFIGKETTFKMRIPVVCDAGYDLVGDSFTTCQSDGSWSKNTTCQIKDCGSVYDLDFGYVNFLGMDTTYGSRVPAACDPGYSLAGDQTITCLAGGKWSTATSCRVKDCGMEYYLENGHVDFAGRKTIFNEKIPVTCNEGYDIQGDYQITCLETGFWSNYTFCRVRDCGSEYVVKNGYVEFSGKPTTFESRIPVTCSDGYKNQGEDHITCQADGTWTTHTFCQIRDCGARYTLTNGRVDFEGRATTYNSIVPVTCAPGYEIDRDDFIICQNNGQWSTVECHPKDCGMIYPLENGYVDFIGRDTTFDHTVPVVCDPGFEIQGQGYLTCRSDGQWSKSSRCHIKDCGTEYMVDNGFANFDGRDTTFNHTVPVICNKGYAVLGDSEITCLSTGMWSNNTVCHIEDCGTDYKLENGKVYFKGKSTKYKSKVPVTCDTGYDLVGKAYITCQADGSWSNDVVCKIKDCGKDYQLDGGLAHFDGRPTTYKSNISVSCLDGYNLHGDNYTTCLANGRWSKTTKCQPKDCGTNYPVDHGHVNFVGQATTFNNKILVHCDTGYENDGPEEITCLASGTWSTDSTCQIKDCGTDLVIQNGEVDFAGHKTVYESSVPVSCHPGFDLHGQSSSTCLADGTWSKKTTCVIKDCGQNYILANGHVNFSGVKTTFGHTVPISCDEGYTVIGEPHITCLADGSWSTNTKCQIKDCGNDFAFDHGSVDFSNKQTTYNQTITVTCESEYELEGSPEIICLANGSWSVAPVCRQKPEASGHGAVVGGVVSGIVIVAIIAVVIIILRKNQKLCFAKTSILEREFGDLENETRVTM